MKTASVIKAAKKAGLSVEIRDNRIFIESTKTDGGFFDQDGRAVCLNTISKKNIADHKPEFDSRMDSFHYSIKGFLAAFA